MSSTLLQCSVISGFLCKDRINTLYKSVLGTDQKVVSSLIMSPFYFISQKVQGQISTFNVFSVPDIFWRLVIFHSLIFVCGRQDSWWTPRCCMCTWYIILSLLIVSRTWENTGCQPCDWVIFYGKGGEIFANVNKVLPELVDFELLQKRKRFSCVGLT